MASFSQAFEKRGVLSSLITAVLLFSAYASAGVAMKHSHLHDVVDLQKRHDETSAPSKVTHQGYKAVGYYVNWAIYGRNWGPENIQSEHLTHLLYAFASIDNKTGEASLADPSADVQKKFDGDDAADNSTDNLYGILKQIYIHKKKNRNLKTLLSIGGWNARFNFAPPLASEKGRKTFAKSSVQLLKDLGFDGLDIDWEYPNTTKQAQDLVDTCKEFRLELDKYSATLDGKPHFLLTLAVPAGPDHFPFFNMPALTPYVDFVNLMGYDYAGSFSDYSGHSANVYPSFDNPHSTNFSTQAAMDYYLKEAQWDAQKLTLGMPIYGRSFANTTGPGAKFDNATDGSWENGVWDYKAVAGNSSFGKVYTDDQTLASYSYCSGSECKFNGTHQYMVSYDTADIAYRKAQYLKLNGLGGAMWWELSGDTPINGTGPAPSLIKTVTDFFQTCGGFEQCQNVLDYPESKYKNLRDGMPGH